jgi:diguanylate cyclase (GGDEF)-like protein
MVLHFPVALHQSLIGFCFIFVAIFHRQNIHSAVPILPPTPSSRPKRVGPRRGIAGFLAGFAITALPVAGYFLAPRSALIDALAAATCLLIGIMLLVAVFRTRAKLEQTTSELDAARATVNHMATERDGQLALLRVAVDHMSQGLCMFGPDRKLIMSNERYAELYGIRPGRMRPGMDLAEILASRIAAGNVPAMGQTAYIERMREIANRGQPAETIIEQTDGRVFLLGYVPMANGGWVATHQDITDRRLAEAKIAHMARHDALTNLPNRTSFREQLEQAVARVKRGEMLAVLCLDLDRFKGINDTLGHHFGDLLLTEVAHRLKSCVRETDTVSRLSGDEFAILQVALKEPAEATALSRRIVDALAEPFDLEGHQAAVSTSIGIAIAPNDGSNPDQIMKNADLALYRAKADGRGTYRFFEADMDNRMRARRALEADLKRAIAEHEFTLHYQSIVNLKSRQIGAFEALLRWNHPTRGMIEPADFIPVAEEAGLIVPLGEWVIRQACRDATAWPEHIRVAVNLSPVQLRSSNLVPTVAAATSSGLVPQRLELEITETVMIQDIETTLETLNKLRAIGVRISMDDFGTGYSSLSHLRKFPFDTIKIDRSFVHDMGAEQDTVAIVRAVSALGKSLGMTTTAEGVETAEQLERVQSEGYTEVQGFLLSRPVPASEIAGLLARSPSNILPVARAGRIQPA